MKAIIKMYDVQEFIELIREWPAIWDRYCPEYVEASNRQKAWEEVGRNIYSNWNDISNDLAYKEEKIRELKQKWKNLRDTYAKYCNQPKRKKYIYADSLSFLKETFDKRKSLVVPNNRKLDEYIIEETTDAKTEPNSDNEFEEEREIEAEPIQEPDLELPRKRARRERGQLRNRERRDEADDYADADDDHRTDPIGIFNKRILIHETQHQRKEPNDRNLIDYQMKILQKIDKDNDDADRCFLLSLLPDYKKLTSSQKTHFKMMNIKFFDNIENPINEPAAPSTSASSSAITKNSRENSVTFHNYIPTQQNKSNSPFQIQNFTFTLQPPSAATGAQANETPTPDASTLEHQDPNSSASILTEYM